MQHPPELKTKFLELRAQGVSYGRIADAIGVSKPTLIQWGKSMAEEITDLQVAERELVREKLLGNFEQWLGRQVHHFNRLDAEFGRRELKYSPTESVFRMMMASRKLLDRYFFEHDRPSRSRTHTPNRNSNLTAAAPAPASEHVGLVTDTRANCAAAPSAPSENGNTTDKTVSESRDAQATRADSRAVPSPGGEGQDEGDSRSLSVAAPQPSADDALETGAYSENPAKTQPFPGQNSGVHNLPLSSSPPTVARSELCTYDERAATQSGAIPSPLGRGIEGEGQTSTPNSALALPGPSFESESKIENPNSKIPWSRIPARQLANAESKNDVQSQLTVHDSEADFGGESIPINPFESTREWLERQGIQVSKIPKGARIVTSG